MRIYGLLIACVVLLAGCLAGYRNVLYDPKDVNPYLLAQKEIPQAIQEVASQEVAPLLEEKAALEPSVIGTIEEQIKNLPLEFQQVIQQVTQQITKAWGQEEAPLASKDVYVKYTDSYLSRAQVDFSSGKIKVSTIDENNPKEALKQAIVTTLLTPEDPEKVDLYSDRDVEYTSKPYLANLVKDHENTVVLYPWRANRYANHLVKNKLQVSDIVVNGQKKKMYAVEFDMVDDRVVQSENKYGQYVAQYAKEFQLDQALIYAIIKTESSFNPYAVSHIPAYGLMQVVPASAGRDAYKSINNRDGIPTKSMLFTPKINIQYGSAYLDILFNRYLKGIKNSLSHEYCVIAAYNTGSGNVLSIFHKDRKKAIDVINSMTSADVYRKLRSSLKYEEARNYVLKVTTAKKEFQTKTPQAKNTIASYEMHGSL